MIIGALMIWLAQRTVRQTLDDIFRHCAALYLRFGVERSVSSVLTQPLGHRGSGESPGKIAYRGEDLEGLVFRPR